jgi:hypothetical protein
MKNPEIVEKFRKSDKKIIEIDKPLYTTSEEEEIEIPLAY